MNDSEIINKIIPGGRIVGLVAKTCKHGLWFDVLILLQKNYTFYCSFKQI
jgi:hypothetical protein